MASDPSSPLVGQSESAWTVVAESGVFDLQLVLANPELEGTDNDRRLVVTWNEAEDDPAVMAVYPCRVCGWDRACGEDCHS